ncbi:hypothetical protein D9N00_18900 [Pseudomonas syringae pv. actinidiae]|uniref:hypothetical protein n=1 Tax=Pseudomonas syringae TaxID=317 RepID=UPI000EF1366B|nr:hypothetical protein [Pseudomonas syringae]AYL16353.1 hypothetical protein D9N00_18900 [Pseudomonas syringae pv. actinidiae]
MKYRIGPEPELLKEIGQIMVNYSACEHAIHSIFRAVMSLDEQQTYLLVSKANLNAEKMVGVIKSELHRIRPLSLHESILSGLTDFTKSIPKRNTIAHWQWAVTTDQAGMATNSLKAKPGQDIETRDYSLKDLQLISWEIARATVLLTSAATMIRGVARQALAGNDWVGNRYEFDSDILNELIQYSIDRTRKFITDYEADNFPIEQPPSSDKSR